jgi:glycerophosphoryl diester phosphodiesterase
VSVRDRLRLGDVVVLGHRGDSQRFPENTLAAFDSALRIGADGVELDVRLSADSVPMVMHDPSLLRTVGIDVAVSGQSSAELQRHDVPSLAEALDLVRGRGLVAIELKDDVNVREGAAAAVIATVRRTGMGDDVMLLAFDHRHLVEARTLDGEVFTVALVADRNDDVAALVEAVGADGVGPLALLIDAALVQSAHRSGAIVAAWTVDDEEEAAGLAGMGCDVLITNRPAAVIGRLRH